MLCFMLVHELVLAIISGCLATRPIYARPVNYLLLLQCAQKTLFEMLNHSKCMDRLKLELNSEIHPMEKETIVPSSGIWTRYIEYLAQYSLSYFGCYLSVPDDAKAHKSLIKNDMMHVLQSYGIAGGCKKQKEHNQMEEKV